MPAGRFDTAYHERRVVAWDGYIDVRGNRYSVPGELCGTLVQVRIGLDGSLATYHGEGHLVARHRLQSATAGWVLMPEHHRILCDKMTIQFGVDRGLLRLCPDLSVNHLLKHDGHSEKFPSYLQKQFSERY